MIDEFRAGKEKIEIHWLSRLIKIIKFKKISLLPKTGTNRA